MNKLLPGIDQYLEQIDDNKPITTEGLEDIIYKVVVHTGLSYTASEIIVKEYFQQIRNELLNGNIINISHVGKIFIACPKNGLSKKRITTLIKPMQKLKKWLKYE